MLRQRHVDKDTKKGMFSITHAVDLMCELFFIVTEGLGSTGSATVPKTIPIITEG